MSRDASRLCHARTSAQEGPFCSQLVWILVSPFFPFKSVLSVLFFLQIMFLSLDTPEENPYCPTYIFPELPEIQQKTEGTRSLVRVSVVLCFELTVL